MGPHTANILDNLQSFVPTLFHLVSLALAFGSFVFVCVPGRIYTRSAMLIKVDSVEGSALSRQIYESNLIDTLAFNLS